MKALILVVLALGTATESLAADCKTAATNAGLVATLQSDVYYHCVNMDTTFDQKQNAYIVVNDCVGETGSGNLTYRVSFADSSCSSPTVVGL